jgi:preprotein translocase subunit SecB
MTQELVKHAIQLKGIAIKELFIRINSYEQNDNNNEIDRRFKLSIGHSEFDRELGEMDVGIVVNIGNPSDHEGDEKKSEFDLKVHLLAKFSVDQNRFPIEQIDHWAENNAPLVLYPYIREHVHALSIRAGIKPILLPLMEVPTLRIDK